MNKKYYSLEAIVHGSPVKLKRSVFASRSEAVNYMFNYYEDNYLYNLQVRDEYPVEDNKHRIEYYCDFNNRFIVTRI